MDYSHDNPFINTISSEEITKSQEIIKNLKSKIEENNVLIRVLNFEIKNKEKIVNNLQKKRKEFIEKNKKIISSKLKNYSFRFILYRFITKKNQYNEIINKNKNTINNRIIEVNSLIILSNNYNLEIINQSIKINKIYNENK